MECQNQGSAALLIPICFVCTTTGEAEDDDDDDDDDDEEGVSQLVIVRLVMPFAVNNTATQVAVSAMPCVLLTLTCKLTSRWRG
jgi:hypothetical protein